MVSAYWRTSTTQHKRLKDLSSSQAAAVSQLTSRRIQNKTDDKGSYTWIVQRNIWWFKNNWNEMIRCKKIAVQFCNRSQLTLRESQVYGISFFDVEYDDWIAPRMLSSPTIGQSVHIILTSVPKWTWFCCFCLVKLQIVSWIQPMKPRQPKKNKKKPEQCPLCDSTLLHDMYLLWYIKLYSSYQHCYCVCFRVIHQKGLSS